MRYKGLELLNQLQLQASSLLIDVNKDLGTYSAKEGRFLEPVDQLINPITGKGYTPKTQQIIKDLRKSYLRYIEIMQTEFKETAQPDDLEIITHYFCSEKQRKKIADYVKSKLALGYFHTEIAKELDYKPKTLRNQFKRQEYYQRSNVEEVSRQNLAQKRVYNYLQSV